MVKKHLQKVPKNSQKLPFLKSQKKKTPKMPRKAINNSLPFNSTDIQSIIPGESHFYFESTTRENTCFFTGGGLNRNNFQRLFEMSLDTNAFSEDKVNIDEKINNFNVDNYKTNF